MSLTAVVASVRQQGLVLSCPCSPTREPWYTLAAGEPRDGYRARGILHQVRGDRPPCRVKVRVTVGLGLGLALVLRQVLGDRHPCTRTHPHPRTPTRSHAPTHALTHHALTPTPHSFPAPLTHAMPLHPRAGLGRSGSSVMRWFRWAESALRDAAGMHTVEALRGGGVRTMAYDQRYAQSEVRRGYMDTSSSTSPKTKPEREFLSRSR